MDIKNQDERGFFTRANFMAYSLREVSKRKGSLCADLARSQSRFVPKLLVTNAVELSDSLTFNIFWHHPRNLSYAMCRSLC